MLGREFAIVVLICASSTSLVAQAPLIAERAAAAKKAPRDVAAQTALGVAQLRAGAYADAERAFETAHKLAPDDPTTTLHVAEVELARGDYKRARNTCKELFPKKGTPSPIAHVCMARAYLAWNRSSRAFEDLDAANALSPNLPEAEVVRGHAHRLRVEADEALKAYEKAKASPTLASEANLGIGKLYVALGKPKEAEAALRAALKLDPTWPEIQLELGRLLGGTEEGLKLLQSALEGRPGWGEAALALGDAKKKAGDLVAAESAYRQALRADATLSPAYAGLGEVLLRADKLDEAEAALQKSLSLVKNNARAVLALSELYVKRAMIDEAVESFRHAADLDPRDPTGLSRAAEVLLGQSRVTLAAGFLDRLLEQHPRSARGLMLYGDIAVARGDKAQAKSFYQRALGGEGEFDRARVEDALKQLR